MSKTVNQLLDEIKASESLQKEFVAVLQEGKESIEAFMKKNDCDSSYDEAKEVIREIGQKAIDNGELTPDQLEAVQGGTGILFYTACSLAIGGFLSVVGISVYKTAQKNGC